MGRCAISAVLAGVASVLVHAQDPQPEFRTGVSLVEVAAVVTDPSGRPIGDLTVDDFEVYEDGALRSIVSFRRLAAEQRVAQPARRPIDAYTETLSTNVGLADAPAFVLVLDDLNTSPFDAHRAIRAGLGVLGALPSDGLVAVVTTSGLGGSLLTLAPPGPEHAERIRAFRGRVLLSGPKDRAPIQTTPSSVDAPCGVGSKVLQSQDCGDPTRAARRAEVIDAVARILSRAGSRRKVVFWVTEDMGVSPLDPAGNQRAQRAALSQVLNADVAVYPVNPREGHADARDRAEIAEGDRGDNRPDRRSGGRVRVGPGASVWGGPGGATLELNTDDMVAVTLDQIARESGGRWITNANDLETVLADVVTQNTTSYLLAFEGQSTQVPGRHAIDVRVRRDDLRVFARRAYVVPDKLPAATNSAASATDDTSALLGEIASGAVSQGQLAMTVQAVPEFAIGRTGRVLVSVHIDPTTAGGLPVDLAILSVDGDGAASTQQRFHLTTPTAEAPWALTTPLTLSRGQHQIRVAAVTRDGSRSGLVVAPVTIVEPGSALLMASPVLLGAVEGGAITPTLTRALPVGAPIAVQVEIAGRPVRDQRVSVGVRLHDAEGTHVRETDARLDPGPREDRVRATAVLSTSGLPSGAYTLVVEARDAKDSQVVRHAVMMTLHAPTPEPIESKVGAASAADVSLRPLAVAHGPTTTYPETGPRVIRDEAAWEAFWRHLPTQQARPDIDFARVTLLVFVVDDRVASQGEPQVDRVEREGEVMVVHWRLAPRPPDERPGQADPRRPFLVVGIIGHDGPVRFSAIE